jgi:hypothetical protein
MNIGALVLLSLTVTLMLLTVQRTEARRRVVVAIILGVIGLLIQRYANYRELHAEALIALILSIIINLFYWAILGRYNPPGSSEDIQVLGMDD